MFLARTNDNQRNARGKSDAVPQKKSHKRRHTNYLLARRARRKSEVGTARCVVRGHRSAMSLPKKIAHNVEAASCRFLLYSGLETAAPFSQTSDDDEQEQK